MGYRRAGWYGYDWHNDGIPSAEAILREWQHLKAGESIPMWRNLNFPVEVLDANRFLVFASPNKEDSMALGLYPLDTNHTRLVWRIRLGPYNWKPPWIAAQLLTDLADFLAVRQDLMGIKARAESKKPAAPAHVYAELGLWLVSLLAFLIAELVLTLRKELLRPLIAASTTGFVTVCLVRGQPPLSITAIGTFTNWALGSLGFPNGKTVRNSKEPGGSCRINFRPSNQ